MYLLRDFSGQATASGIDAFVACHPSDDSPPHDHSIVACLMNNLMLKLHTEIYNGATTNQSVRPLIALRLFGVADSAAHGGQDGPDVGGCRIPAAAAGRSFLFVIVTRGRHILHSC